MHVTSVVSCALTFSTWIVSCSSKTSSHHGRISYSNYIIKDTHMQKRAGKILGIASYKAIQYLLRGAIELPPTGTTRQYVKPGTYLTASRDFLRTHATDRETFRLPSGHTGITGKIGDRDIITLRPNKKDGMPVIVIKTTGDGTTQGEITHRIKYMATEY